VLTTLRERVRIKWPDLCLALFTTILSVRLSATSEIQNCCVGGDTFWVGRCCENQNDGDLGKAIQGKTISSGVFINEKHEWNDCTWKRLCRKGKISNLRVNISLRNSHTSFIEIVLTNNKCSIISHRYHKFGR